MKNIYNITKGQFITLWIFGIIATIKSMEQSDYGSEIADLLMILIPFTLIFYSIGYRNHKKNNPEK